VLDHISAAAARRGCPAREESLAHLLPAPRLASRCDSSRWRRRVRRREGGFGLGFFGPDLDLQGPGVHGCWLERLTTIAGGRALAGGGGGCCDLLGFM
jgi:hypothetical protein